MYDLSFSSPSMAGVMCVLPEGWTLTGQDVVSGKALVLLPPSSCWDFGEWSLVLDQSALLITQEPASQNGGRCSMLVVGSQGLDWLTTCSADSSTSSGDLEIDLWASQPVSEANSFFSLTCATFCTHISGVFPHLKGEQGQVNVFPF